MATNKNALIRYRTIDRCLQNRTRRWTLDDLIDACSEALYEYEGKHSSVSKRTVQLDIQIMRGSKLGYEAPIIVYDKRYYTYEDESYTIRELPIDQLDMDILQESMEMLRQFKDFSLFSELDGVIQKLEDKIYRESKMERPIIHMDKNENLKGLHHLDTLYQSILKKVVICIDYQSFKARACNQIVLHPYLLKQYNNRWFLVGRHVLNNRILTLALDRIEGISYDLSFEYEDNGFDPDQYYFNTFGVTVLTDSQIIDIELWIDRMNAPYILTKPIHHSQKEKLRNRDGSVLISLRVHHNFEIERLILGFGPGIKVLSPRRLRSRIKKLTKEAAGRYEADISSEQF